MLTNANDLIRAALALGPWELLEVRATRRTKSLRVALDAGELAAALAGCAELLARAESVTVRRLAGEAVLIEVVWWAW